MDNLQTEVLEIEFLSYSNGMNTISEEDFAHILLRYTNVENTSVFWKMCVTAYLKKRYLIHIFILLCMLSYIGL